MSALGDLLELLHGAQEPFRTLRAVYRTWTHRARSTAAFLAMAEAGGGSIHTFADDDEREREPESMRIVRIWRQRDSARTEEVGSGEGGYGVRVGERWWSWSHELGAISNELEPDVGSGTGEELRALLDPTQILAAARFEPLGRASVAGRATITARAIPRHAGKSGRRPFSDAFALHDLGAGGDRYLLDVDAERGVLLRVEAIRDGLPFQRTEAVEIAFDEPLEDDLFVFRAPPGESVRSPRERGGRPEHVSIVEAQRRARFPVLMPETMPHGWELRCIYVGPSQRPDAGASVHLACTSPSGHEALSIRESASSEALRRVEGTGWESLEQEGREFEVCSLGSRAQLRLERGGTAVHMSSSSLDVRQLARIAAALVEAPSDSDIS